MLKSRKYLLIGLIAINAIAAVLLALSRTDYRVDLSSVVEIWGDVIRDADKFGRTLTTVSIEKEIEIGNEIAKSFHPISDENLQKYINEVGQTLTAHVRRRGIPYKFQVIDWPVVNAFAVAGGHIYITTGMLNSIDSEAELAGILAHEIAHVDLKHVIQALQYELLLRRIVGEDLASIVRVGEYLLTVSYSEQREREADRTGMIIMAEAGYSPIEAIRAFVGVGSELPPLPERPIKPDRPELEIGRAIKNALGDYFATHPVWPDRVQDLDTILQRNIASWEGRAFYIGRSNYRDHVARSVDQRADETIIYSADLPEMRVARGELLSLIGNYDQAINHLNRAIASDPKMIKAYRLRASAYASLGDYEKSIRDLDAAFDIWRSELDGLRVQLETVSDDPEQALRIEILSKMIALKADQRSLKLHAADVIEKLARPERTAAAKEAAANLGLELADLMNERGFLLLDQGRFNDAWADFGEALSLSPKSKEAAGGKAIALLSSIIAKNPQDAEAYLKRGNHYRDLGMLGRAIADYSQAIAVEPQMAKAYAERGFVLFDQERFGEALADFDAALALFPEQQEAADGTALASLSVEILLARSERGEPEAQYALANAYTKGEAAERNQAQAVHWWRKAAESGHPGAQEKLANAYRTGDGVLLDFKESAHWARKVVESNLASTKEAISQISGDSDAMLQLANTNRFGRGTPRDMSKALTLYRRAAATGNAEAAFILGVLYERGEEVEQNLVMAHMWFSIAEPASSHAQIRKKYLIRKLSRTQIAEAEWLAREWLEAYPAAKEAISHTKAEAILLETLSARAEGGDSDAMLKLANTNRFGRGTPRDMSKALTWYRRAAAAGNAEAAFILGVLYERGEEVEQNLVMAHMWFSIAAANSSPGAAKERNIVARRMTEEQITEAERLAHEWQARSRSSSTPVRHAVEPGATDYRVCYMAINSSDGDWEKHPSFGNWIDEARSRGLKLKDCVKLVKANEVIRDRAFGRAPDKRVCSMAIENGSWQQKASMQKWVDEAQDRGLTLEDCGKILKANEVSRGSSTPSRRSVEPGATDTRICVIATRYDGQWKTDPAFYLWVEEARKRGLGFEDCKKLLEAN
jgi:TPR repeat protein/Zn-dependent protease with chaperone function